MHNDTVFTNPCTIIHMVRVSDHTSVYMPQYVVCEERDAKNVIEERDLDAVRVVKGILVDVE